MKLIFLTILLCSAAQLNAQTKIGVDDIRKLDWLVGEWNRTNIKPGRTSIEKWHRVSATEFAGSGITVKDGDTSVVEKFRIIMKDNEFYYEADVAQNKVPVLFRITRASGTELMCENPEHDFPKMIHYKGNGNNMTATISGNGKSFDYVFERK